MENELSVIAERLVSTTRDAFRAYHSGNLEPWSELLSPDSVYLGSGDPILIGKNAIINHFKKYEGVHSTILNDEYHPIVQSKSCGFVYGQIIIAMPESFQSIVTRLTIVYKITKNKLQITHQHNSYEHQYAATANQNAPMEMNNITQQFIRDILIHQKDNQKIAVPSGMQTVFLNSNMILYVQSFGKRTEFVCTDRTVSCNTPISELKETLPDIFYPIHRSYLVNVNHISAIRRFEAEMVTGAIIPIPALMYTQVKRDLQMKIHEGETARK